MALTANSAAAYPPPPPPPPAQWPQLNAKASPEKLTELMAKINEADAPEVGKKGLKVMKAFIKKELGIKLKNGAAL